MSLLDPGRDIDADEDDDEETGVKRPVGDEENLAQRRTHQRIQAIFDEITNSKIEAAGDLAGEFPEAAHRKRYKETVAELWRELQPPLSRHSEKLETYYWRDIELGEVTVEPPRYLRKPASRQEGEASPDRRPGGSWAEPHSQEIQGFRAFADTPVVLEITFSAGLDEFDVTVDRLRDLLAGTQDANALRILPRSSGRYEEPFRVVKAKVLDESIIDNARFALRELAEELGIGFGDPEETTRRETEPFP